jgi:hypothetical protein
MTVRKPPCPACYAYSSEVFHPDCEGCTARRARIAAEHKAVSDAQVRGADSMFGTLGKAE